MISREYSSELQADLESGTTTLAGCWKFVRTDGEVFGFTNHDDSLEIDGVTYHSIGAGNYSAMEFQADASPDNLDLDLLYEVSGIREEEIKRGAWDHAYVEIFIVSYEDLSKGKIKLLNGYLGEVNSEFELHSQIEFRSLASLLQQKRGRKYSLLCDADLGDSRCGVDLSSREINGSVTATSDNKVFMDGNRTETQDFFKYGVVTWNTGLNAGISMEVKGFIGDILIVAVNTKDNAFIVSGNEKDVISSGETVEVINSSSNNGTYTVSSVEFSPVVGKVVHKWTEEEEELPPLWEIIDDIFDFTDTDEELRILDIVYIYKNGLKVSGDPFYLNDDSKDDRIKSGDKIQIVHTLDNDGKYEVTGASYDSNDDTTTISTSEALILPRTTGQTTIYVDESIPSSTADGSISHDQQGRFELFLGMPNSIQVGDEYTVTPGCDKHFQTCKSKFDNGINFRGFPHVPGRDEGNRYA